MSQWYYSHDGQQKGPVPVSELSRLADSGDFNPEKDLVWREGMPDWQPAASVADLPFGKSKAPEPAPAGDEPEPAPQAHPAEAPSPYVSPAEAPSTSAATPDSPAATAGLAIASLVCGIIGFFTCFVWCLSIPVAVAAIVTGVMALGRITDSNGRLTGRGLAKTGIITGIAGLVLAIIYGAAIVWIASRTPEQIEQMDWMPSEIRESFTRQIELQQEMREEIERKQSE